MAFRLVLPLLFTLFLSLLSACEDTRRPSAGCDPVCTGDAVCCGMTCAQLQSSFENCGACGNECAPGQLCTAGVCTGDPIDAGPQDTSTEDTGGGGECSPPCSDTAICCGNRCVSNMVPGGDGRTDSSFQNCGACGNACDSNTASRCGINAGGSVPACLCGDANACTGGRECAISEGTFRCIDVNTDPANCGAIGNSCGQGESCVGGTCGCGGGPTCGDGQGCCGGSCVDTTSNAEHCGACGNACGDNGPTCVDSTCRCGTEPACRPPEAPDAGASCCDGTCIDNTNDHCGCDGTMCDGGLMCMVGGGLLPGMDDAPCCGMPLFGCLGL